MLKTRNDIRVCYMFKTNIVNTVKYTRKRKFMI